MRKKFFALLLAFGVMCTVPLSGCEKKKTAESVSGEAVPEEITMKEADLSDAEVINVPVQINRDGEMPVNISSAAFPDFENKISACGNEGTPDNLSGEPNEPVMKEITVTDNHAYIIIDYDQFCDLSHECAVYDYDLKTGDVKEVLVHSDSLEGLNISDICCDDEKIYIYCHSRYQNTLKRMVTSFDRNTYESVNILSKDIGLGKSTGIYWGNMWLRNDGLYIENYNILDMEQESFIFNIDKYDFSSGEWTTAAVVDSTCGCDSIPEKDVEVFNVFSDPEKVNLIMTDNKTGQVIISDNRTYSLYTEIPADSLSRNGFTIYGSGEDYVIWFEAGTDGNIISKYVFSENKLYQTNVSSLNIRYGSPVEYNGNLILPSGDLVYYLIPELGMVFVLSKMGNYAYMDIDGDVLHFTGSEGIAQEYGEDGSDAVQNKIYWGTME